MFVDKNMEVLSTWRDSGKYLPSNTKRRQLMMRLLGCFGKRQCKPASLFERQRYAQLRIVTNTAGHVTRQSPLAKSASQLGYGGYLSPTTNAG
jgi:hypothetical protein